MFFNWATTRYCQLSASNAVFSGCMYLAWLFVFKQTVISPYLNQLTRMNYVLLNSVQKPHTWTELSSHFLHKGEPISCAGHKWVCCRAPTHVFTNNFPLNLTGMYYKLLLHIYISYFAMLSQPYFLTGLFISRHRW